MFSTSFRHPWGLNRAIYFALLGFLPCCKWKVQVCSKPQNDRPSVLSSDSKSSAIARRRTVENVDTNQSVERTSERALCVCVFDFKERLRMTMNMVGVEAHCHLSLLLLRLSEPNSKLQEGLQESAAC